MGSNRGHRRHFRVWMEWTTKVNRVMIDDVVPPPWWKGGSINGWNLCNLTATLAPVGTTLLDDRPKQKTLRPNPTRLTPETGLLFPWHHITPDILTQRNFTNNAPVFQVVNCMTRLSCRQQHPSRRSAPSFIEYLPWVTLSSSYPESACLLIYSYLVRPEHASWARRTSCMEHQPWYKYS